MDEKDLHYGKLTARLEKIRATTGLSESAAFLVWFLENIYRLEETEARDAVCDHALDKGIDGIYVDDNEAEIHFLQSKIRQKKTGTVGDVGPKELVASLQQFDSLEKVDAILAGNADHELKQLITRTRIADLVDKGYQLIGVYVTNELRDRDSISYQKLSDNIRVFDRQEIASRFIELDPAEGKEKFTFDTSYVEPMSITSGTTADKPTMYVFPAKALQLVHMDGISDGTLFRENVRYTLGNTAVNRSIRKSIAEKRGHSNFVLFHNGIIILCTEVDDSNDGELTIKNYSVVNGAQSLTSFFNDKNKLTDDLRVLVRIIALRDDALARTITENSNNQNAIKPRDLRSNHPLMLRLQKEMAERCATYFFEIKRGEQVPAGKLSITNDSAGRCLLAFDIQEPWSAHQIYKVFDEKYADIFGRPEVNAERIVFIHELMHAVEASLEKLVNRPMASYTLTRYFLLYVLSRILRESIQTQPFVARPASLQGADRIEFFRRCSEILKTVAVDLNYESNSVDFDYKSVLKSPNQCSELAKTMHASYDKDVARNKAESFEDWSPPGS